MTDEPPSLPDPKAFAKYLPRSGEAAFEELELCLEYEKALAKQKEHPRRELPFGADAQDLAQTGWGVIFAHGADPLVCQQLHPLLDLRKRQAKECYEKIFFDRDKESGRTFLLKRGEIPGVIDPSRIPYYLLLVGGPEEIPFEVQYYLAINHAVGRIAFDSVADYGHYARAVVDAETVGVALTPKCVSFFSVERGDWETALLARHIVEPFIPEESWNNFAPGWDRKLWRGEQATKEQLGRLINSGAQGILILSAHGKQLGLEHPEKQKREQGAILCQDEYFSARDVAEDARLNGQLVLLLACHGAGTPIVDDFPDEPGGRGKTIAARPFVAALPQSLLARGALAVVGHVDRGWTLSFAWGIEGKEVTAAGSFKDMLRRLSQGERLGHAMRPLQRRATALAAGLVWAIHLHEMIATPGLKNALLHVLHLLQRNAIAFATNMMRAVGLHGQRNTLGSQNRLVIPWRAYHDARNFVILGDPAIYPLGQSEKRPFRKSEGGAGNVTKEKVEDESMDEIKDHELPDINPINELPHFGQVDSRSVADLLSSGLVGADLILIVLYKRTPTGIRLTYLLPSPAYKLASKDLDIDPVSYFHGVLHQIENMRDDDAQERLAKRGHLLFKQLVPREIGDILLAASDQKQRKLHIISEEAWIPWDALCLGSLPDSALAHAFHLTQQLATDWVPPTKLPLKRLALVIPRDSALPGSSVERDYLLSLEGCQVGEIKARRKEVVREMKSGGYQGWHFAGHGIDGGENPDDWSLLLEKRELLQPFDLLDTEHLGGFWPLAFLNTCHSAQGTPSLSGPGGLVRAFLDQGAGAVIASRWAVDDGPSLCFSKEFYNVFLRGGTIGNAVHEARLQVKQKFKNSPAWLAYTVYAHPLASRTGGGEGPARAARTQGIEPSHAGNDIEEAAPSPREHIAPITDAGKQASLWKDATLGGSIFLLLNFLGILLKMYLSGNPFANMFSPARNLLAIFTSFVGAYLGLRLGRTWPPRSRWRLLLTGICLALLTINLTLVARLPQQNCSDPLLQIELDLKTGTKHWTTEETITLSSEDVDVPILIGRAIFSDNIISEKCDCRWFQYSSTINPTNREVTSTSIACGFTVGPSPQQTFQLRLVVGNEPPQLFSFDVQKGRR